MLQNPPVTTNSPVTVRIDQVDLVSVTGQLDHRGLDRLQCRLDELLDGGARLVLADLSGVTGCDRRLFDLLVRTQHLATRGGGWLHLVGLGPPVWEALDEAALPELLQVYRATRWPGTVPAEPPPSAPLIGR